MSGKYTLIEVTRLTELESRVRELEAEREELKGRLLAYKQDFATAVSDLNELRIELERCREMYKHDCG